MKTYWYDPQLQPSDVTPKDVYLNRREFLKTGAAIGAMASVEALSTLFHANPAGAAEKIAEYRHSDFTVADKLTSYDDVTGYTNFYEFGFGKGDPAKHAKQFVTKPWSIAIEGETGKPGVYDSDEILKPHPLEERVYRWRCVEAWSMVVPWIGFPLADLLQRFEPTSNAKYVEFTTVFAPEQMPMQKAATFPFPYVEGLRMDEAMHPLTFVVVGVYGERLPNQNGAPLRIVVPWKYGFKSPKSIAKIRFAATEPATTWSTLAPEEYGFYANVNPEVNHPRWSQAEERRIGESGVRETLLFNGYEAHVAHLYAGMDLRTYF